MISTQRRSALKPGAGAALYLSPYAPLLCLTTPFHQPSVLLPRPSSPASDRASLPPQHHSGDFTDGSRWYFQAPSADGISAREGTWTPRRQPDRVEWDDIQGGRLMWTPHARTDDLPPLPDVPTRDINSATDPLPIDQAVSSPAHVPGFSYSYTHTRPFAYLPICTPVTISIPLVPLPGATPAEPPAKPIISPLLELTSWHQSLLEWNAISSISPTAGNSIHQNYAPVSAGILNKPATDPPMPFLYVRFGGSSAVLTDNWGILTIESPSYKAFHDKKNAKNPKKTEKGYNPVTIGDFFSEILKFLHTEVTEDEWEGEKPLFSSARVKNEVESAMKQRYRVSPGLCWRGWREDLKRVDVLRGKTIFHGAQIVRFYNADETWSYGVEAQFGE